ncbi:TetR/AcrR family transcriptional regulator [Rhodococcus qingshengii]|uniref:TetR/AcrR family transcriptional regulator n=1 Tax=Rhodococcus qingshengii TaxID=334542 RepID=UPI0035DF150A
MKLRIAFLELAHEDPTKLSVSAVCERTQVDRATFYRHFESIDDLVADALGDLAEQASVRWEATSTGSGDQITETTEIFRNYLAHIVENWALYQWALSPGGSARTMHALLSRFAHSIAVEIHKLDPNLTPEERDLRAAFAAGGLLGVCIDWLSTDKPHYSPEELTTKILQISDQHLTRVLT